MRPVLQGSLPGTAGTDDASQVIATPPGGGAEVRQSHFAKQSQIPGRGWWRVARVAARRLGLGGARGCGGGLRDVGGAVHPALLDLPARIDGHGLRDLLQAGEAGGCVVAVGVGAVGEGRVAVGPFGLEAAEFSHVAVEFAVRGGVGAVDGGLHGREVAVELGIEAGSAGGEQGLTDRAAAETPGGADDFDGEGFFDNVGRGEAVAPGGDEGFMGGALAGWTWSRAEKRPVVMALEATRALPSGVTGPVEWAELRRLAAI